MTNNPKEEGEAERIISIPKGAKEHAPNPFNDLILFPVSDQKTVEDDETVKDVGESEKSSLPTSPEFVCKKCGSFEFVVKENGPLLCNVWML